MAKVILDEVMKSSIVIDSNPAQKALLDLEKRTRELNAENKDLNIEKKKLIKLGKEETEEYKTVTASIKKNTAELKLNKVEMMKLQQEIGITGLTMKQLGDQAKLLRMKLLNAIPEGEAHKKYTAELAQVSGRIDELKGKANTAGSSIGSLADKFNRYQGLAISVIAGLTGVALSIQKIIDINGKLSDAQSDVMKTTGQTKEEVDALTKSFGLLQTRTSRIDLLGIAEQGGRIGIAKAEIGSFVEVMNMAAVSLGDSFSGGAEEVASKLGKLKFLFKETKDMGVEHAYNSIGSAINDLGANGVASEANIAEFATRLGSLPDVLKPSIKEALALGAAFEESGIEAEVSARAYNIFLKQASTESGKFAKVMKISQAEVEALINKNPLEFMLKFSKGMAGVDVEGTKMAQTLDYLGINADGANKIIGAMGNNMERFTELIDLSNNSFASATSLINEYKIKNSNLAATLEKINKTVTGWFSSETFIKWLGGAVEWLAKFIGATDDADGSVAGWRNSLIIAIKVISVAAISIFSYSAALKFATLWSEGLGSSILYNTIVEKGSIVLTYLKITALTIYTTVMGWFGIATDKATTSLARLNLATKVSPWGVVIALVVATIAAYVAFREEADNVNKALQAQGDVAIKAAESTAVQKQTIKDLTAIMQDENATIDQKTKALTELQKMSSGYLDDLTLANSTTQEGIGIMNRYIDAIDRMAKAKAIAALKTELDAEKLKSENAILGLSVEKTATNEEGNSWAGSDGKWFGLGDRNKMEIQLDMDEEKKNQDQINNRIKALDMTKSAEVKILQASIVKHKLQLEGVKKESKEANKIAQDIKNDTNALNIIIGLPSIETTVNKEESGFDLNAGANDKGGAKNKSEKKDPNTSKEDIYKLQYESEKKYTEAILKNARQLEDERISTMEDGYSKELAIENLRTARKIEDLNNQKTHAEELLKFDSDIANAKKNGNKTLEDHLISQKETFIKRNAALDKQVDLLETEEVKTHNLKLATIQERAAKDAIEKEKENYELGKVQRETAYYEQLLLLGNNESAKAKLKKEYEIKESEAQRDFLEKLVNEQQNILKGLNDNVNLELLTPEQKETFADNIIFLKNKIAALLLEIKKLKGEETSGADFSILQGDGTDILGFSPEQWNGAFKNLDTLEGKIKAAEVVFGGLKNAWSLYSSSVEANQQRELASLDKSQNVQKQKLQKQLNNKVISQVQYDNAIKKLDAEKEKAQAIADYKRAKNERVAALLSIATSTGIGIMKAVAASPLTGGMPWTAIIGGLGLLQAALVLKNPLPAKGFEQGLYPEYVKRQQDGKTFKSTYGGKTRSGLVKDTTHFMVAENGPEMVIDNKAWKQMPPALKDSLVRELQGIKGFEQGLYNENLKRYEVPAASGSAPASSSDSQMLAMVLNVISENTAVMKDIKESGILAIVSNRDYNSMKNLKEGIKKYDELRTNNKL